MRFFIFMVEYSKEFLEKTIKTWQPYRETSLSLEDAREITDNVIALYTLLSELEKKYGKEKTNI